MNAFKHSCLYSLVRKLLHISLAALLVFTVVAFLVTPVMAQLKGDPELLRLTAMTHKNNRERIHTWQGCAYKEDTYADANGLTFRQKSSIPFLYDKRHDAVRWKMTPLEIFVRKENRLVPMDRALETINGIIKDDAYYKYWPSITTLKGERKNSLVIWPRIKVRKSSYSESFHPMWYLTGHMTRGLDDLSERLMFFYRDLTNPALSDATIARTGDIVTFVLTTRENDLMNQFVFDLAKGGNIVKYYTEFKKNRELREWTYEQLDGIWITKTFAFEHLQPDDRYTKQTMKVTFAENKLNESISPSEFSVQKLGIQVGDPVTDRIIGLSYHYGGRLREDQRNMAALSEETSAVQTETTPEKKVITENAQQPGDNNEPNTVVSKIPLEDDSNNVAYEEPAGGPIAQTGGTSLAKYILVSLGVLVFGAMIILTWLRNAQRTGGD